VRVDGLAEGLLAGIQYKPTLSSFRLIEGGKDDLESDNDDAA
jgi:hypothetical protein